MFAVVAVAVTCIATTAQAQQVQATPDPPVIVTRGEASVKRAPDQAWVSIAAESRASSSAEAQRLAAEAMKSVDSALSRAGLPDGAVRTTGYSLQPDMEYVNGRPIDLYCDDSKAAELALLDQRVDYEVSRGESARGRPVDVLNVFVPGPDPASRVRIALTVLDYDDLRGALRGDSRGQAQRGDLAALNLLRTAP